MNKHTKKRIAKLTEVYGQQQMMTMMASILETGKTALDDYALQLGRMLAEAIMFIEREEIAGPDYRPKSAKIRKWASQPGSIFFGDRKVAVDRPRLRGPGGEVPLKSYEALKKRDTFSGELLLKSLTGLSGSGYQSVLANAAAACGVSSSSVSRHIVEATTKQLKEFAQRRYDDFEILALLIDTVHRGGSAFIVAVGIDFTGQKRALGFWEGATENAEICTELMADLERRGLKLSNKILHITDGGKGVIKALKDRYGKKFAHQRCTIHKDRNIQKHLPKKYRGKAHEKFLRALELTSYEDAKAELKRFEEWLREINPSAADSLLEAFEEILTLHRLKVPPALRKSLHSTNIIESMFARVRACETNIKRYRKGDMGRRWLASALLHAESGFQKIHGYGRLGELRTVLQKQEELYKEVA